MINRTCRLLAALFVGGPFLVACSVDMGGFAFVNNQTASMRISTSEAMLLVRRRCQSRSGLAAQPPVGHRCRDQ
ncbi:MAG: hypothetical protein NTW00_00550 [Hyphomicrobiales bacterium]|nr:hypothetical protein [Hyphomicrobiales bacterium]